MPGRRFQSLFSWMTLIGTMPSEEQDARTQVSILVFLDDAHRQSTLVIVGLAIGVSILVFLDDAHRRGVQADGSHVESSFNPCFLG